MGSYFLLFELIAHLLLFFPPIVGCSHWVDTPTRRKPALYIVITAEMHETLLQLTQGLTDDESKMKLFDRIGHDWLITSLPEAVKAPKLLNLETYTLTHTHYLYSWICQHLRCLPLPHEMDTCFLQMAGLPSVCDCMCQAFCMRYHFCLCCYGGLWWQYHVRRLKRASVELLRWVCQVLCAQTGPMCRQS